MVYTYSIRFCSAAEALLTAWRVDFNLALASFESSLAGVRNLVDFAISTRLAKPPRIVFTSSVSVLRSKPDCLLFLSGTHSLQMLMDQ
jgi:nucleoside-diphosphate-sugar epimerase